MSSDMPLGSIAEIITDMGLSGSVTVQALDFLGCLGNAMELYGGMDPELGLFFNDDGQSLFMEFLKGGLSITMVFRRDSNDSEWILEADGDIERETFGGEYASALYHLRNRFTGRDPGKR